MITDNEIYEALFDYDLESDSAHIDLLPNIKMMIADNQEEFSEVLNEVTCYLNKSDEKEISRATGNMQVWENIVSGTRPWNAATSVAIIGTAFSKAIDLALEDYAERNAEEYIERARQIKHEVSKERCVFDARREAMGA